MITSEKASISFYLVGETKSYAYRSWYHVPRQGDRVMLNAPKGDPEQFGMYEVVSVLFGVEVARERPIVQEITIAIRRLN